jgi:hypothetical protein
VLMSDRLWDKHGDVPALQLTTSVAKDAARNVRGEHNLRVQAWNIHGAWCYVKGYAGRAQDVQPAGWQART